MRINKIELLNFGSYRGLNCFDFESKDPKQCVSVIGGKNGAGKTTLFTAIQVCLYGNYAFGFKSAGKRYLSEIYNLINNQIRIDENEKAHIEIRFQQVDNADLVDYAIRRSWTWQKNEIYESVEVIKNGQSLDPDELQNYQYYLIHLIPPDMLKLYFFDGEKIADYFLSDKAGNIRDALMVLSGNDTFDILYEQVRRVLKFSENAQSDAAKEYFDAQSEIERLRKLVSEQEIELETFQGSIDSLEADILRLKNDYASHGGITIEEWKSLHDAIRGEEEKRERLNWSRRTYATDSLPFIIASDLLQRVVPQIKAEKDLQAYNTLRDTLEAKGFSEMLTTAMQSIGSNQASSDSQKLYSLIRNYLLDKQWEFFEPLFGLSSDEEMQVHSVLQRVNSFDVSTFRKYQKRIDSSLECTKEIRQKIQSSSIENFEAYMIELSAMEEEKKMEHLRKEHLQETLSANQTELAKKEAKLKQFKKAFEEQLKVQSVSTVSGKVLLLLEELQNTIYSQLIQNVESDLNRKFKELFRKRNFFSRIQIDQNFNVHILRDDLIQVSDLITLLRGGNLATARNVLGDTAIEMLQKELGAATSHELRKKLEGSSVQAYTLPVEISKDRLSSGEKQVFVMSLYWAMMNQSKNELPFIIDTPFARIDAEHRANITEHFFKKLSGQLIILSTDEEISSRHMDAMRDQISHVYMLDFGEDKATHIRKNQYFEV